MKNIMRKGDKIRMDLGMARQEQEYRFYINLGMLYEKVNKEQAYLCFENSLFYCNNEAERKTVKKELGRLLEQTNVSIQKTAVIILSYNNIAITRECIESVKKHNLAGTYEIVVVDNASMDGSREWLKSQTDLKLILNSENKGFPEGCNQGIRAADKENNIFLLNNDTIVTPNALFWLRMGLYENEQVGAAGSVSNSAVNYQQVADRYHTINEWMSFAEKNNIPLEFPYEKKGWLMGFAMLIKRKALDRTGLLDTRFFPGNYEDNDLSIRLILNGYQLLLCKNSFIFHYGGKEFAKNESSLRSLLIVNEKKLAAKYNFNYIPYSEVDASLVELVKPAGDDCEVLELGSGLGGTLARIESVYPQVKVIGIEDTEELIRLSQGMIPTIKGNFLEEHIQLPVNLFDYIIIDRSLGKWGDPERLLMKAKKYLKKGGEIILSVQNIDCVKEIQDVKGPKFSFHQIIDFCNECLLEIKQVSFEPARLTEAEKIECIRIAQKKGEEELEILFRTQRLVFEIM